MKTVGEILKQSRLSQKLPLEDIARRTKISISYLKAIENNNFEKLPASAFTKGFMQNYAKLLNLNPKTILAIFRRDYDQDEKGRIIPRGLSEPVKSQKFSLTPNALSLTISIIISLVIAAFFIRQVIVFNSAPDIILHSPQNEEHLSSPVTISGSTHPEASISINNQSISLDPDGNFTTQLNFTSGEHTLVITTTSRNGKERTIQRVIYINDAQN